MKEIHEVEAKSTKTKAFDKRQSHKGGECHLTCLNMAGSSGQREKKVSFLLFHLPLANIPRFGGR